MSDKTTLLREADEAFAELRQAIDGLGEAPMRQVWLGTWGVREILIHISGWHRAMVPAFSHVAKGEPPYPAGTYDDFDAWNARFVEQQSGVKVADIITSSTPRIALSWPRRVPCRRRYSRRTRPAVGSSTAPAPATTGSTPRRSGSGARSQQPESRHAQSAPE